MKLVGEQIANLRRNVADLVDRILVCGRYQVFFVFFDLFDLVAGVKVAWVSMMNLLVV